MRGFQVRTQFAKLKLYFAGYMAGFSLGCILNFAICPFFQLKGGLSMRQQRDNDAAKQIF